MPISRRIHVEHKLVNNMIRSLKEQADKHGVPWEAVRTVLEEGNYSSINRLDDLFGDGGVVRCEKFSDKALFYSLKLGHELESKQQEDIQESLVLLAISRIVDEHYKVN